MTDLREEPVERVRHPRRLQGALEQQLGEGRDGPRLVLERLEQLRQG